MKTIGLIGGTSWISTVEYYRIINQAVNQTLGGVNSAKLIVYSINMADKKNLSDKDRWDAIAAMYIEIALKLQIAGADCIVLCANTPHIIADDITREIQVPLIHIADVTTQAICEKYITRVALLGTKYTMEHPFYKDKLSSQGIETLVPDAIDREFVNGSIYNEMAKGIFSKETKTGYLNIINKLVEGGAEGVILGCTEIPLLIKQEECSVPVFDTTLIHANAAVKFALDM